MSPRAITEAFRVSATTVATILDEFNIHGLDGINDRRTVSDTHRYQALTIPLTQPPPDAHRWTTKAVSQRLPISYRTVQRLWNQNHLDPRLRTWTLLTDSGGLLRSLAAIGVGPRHAILAIRTAAHEQAIGADREMPLSTEIAADLLSALDNSHTSQSLDTHGTHGYSLLDRLNDLHTLMPRHDHLDVLVYCLDRQYSDPALSQWIKNRRRIALHPIPDQTIWRWFAEHWLATLPVRHANAVLRRTHSTGSPEVWWLAPAPEVPVLPLRPIERQRLRLGLLSRRNTQLRDQLPSTVYGLLEALPRLYYEAQRSGRNADAYLGLTAEDIRAALILLADLAHHLPTLDAAFCEAALAPGMPKEVVELLSEITGLSRRGLADRANRRSTSASPRAVPRDPDKVIHSVSHIGVAIERIRERHARYASDAVDTQRYLIETEEPLDTLQRAHATPLKAPVDRADDIADCAIIIETLRRRAPKLTDFYSRAGRTLGMTARDTEAAFGLKTRQAAWAADQRRQAKAYPRGRPDLNNLDKATATDGARESDGSPAARAHQIAETLLNQIDKDKQPINEDLVSWIKHLRHAHQTEELLGGKYSILIYLAIHELPEHPLAKTNDDNAKEFLRTLAMARELPRRT